MRNKCRFCGNVRKEGVVWYDDDYCSGKCKSADGGEVIPAIEHAKISGVVASLDDYLLDYPKKLGQKKLELHLADESCQIFQHLPPFLPVSLILNEKIPSQEEVTLECPTMKRCTY